MSAFVFKSFTDPWKNLIRNFCYDESIWFSINSISKQASLMYIISIYDDKNNQYSFCNIAASVYFAALWTTNQAISLYWFKKKFNSAMNSKIIIWVVVLQDWEMPNLYNLPALSVFLSKSV